MAIDTEMKKETKKELFGELEKLRYEINSYNKELNRANSEKESWFSKKEEVYNTIRKKIKGMKEHRNKRDSLTKNVKELKEKRNKLNEETKKNISELVKLRDEAKNLTKNLKIKDPQMLQGHIDKIEVTLETEAMSFEKEKDISKKLNALKKLLIEASEIIYVQRKIKKLNSEAGKSRKHTLDTHNEMYKLASQSQELHEDIIKNSKEVDELKSKEKEYFKKFAGYKKIFNDVNDKLKGKLTMMNGIREKINKFELEEDEKRKLEETTLIKSKEQEMEEKIKGGKKLTTDDFLAFQEIIKNKKI